MRKFTSFICKNEDTPYSVKRAVWESALQGAILYSCESWICDYLKSTMKPFLTTQMLLLGVRPQTCTDLVTIEMGCGTAKSYIQRRQLTFLKKLRTRKDVNDSPVYQAIEMAKEAKCKMGLYIEMMENMREDPVQLELNTTRTNILETNSTKRQTYLRMKKTVW